MMTEDNYNLLKDCFIDSQILFDKLNRVAVQAEELYYDESGLYQEDEERLERHWLKLSSKIVDKLSEKLNSQKIELLKNSELTAKELKFNISTEEELSKISVDYSENGSLRIIQVS